MGIKTKGPELVNSRWPRPATRGAVAALLLMLAARGAPADEASVPSPPPEASEAADVPTAPAPDSEPAPAAPSEQPAEGAPVESTAPAPAPSVPSPADPLPQIEARDFPVVVVRRSSSGRTYLFEDSTDAKTRPGKILLLRRDEGPIMAFRVVKTYPEDKRFAAKRVRSYGDVKELDSGASFNALEKVGDIIPPPPTPQDTADLKELEAAPPSPEAPASPPPAPAGPEVQPFDHELDAATTPLPTPAEDNKPKAPDLQEEEDRLAHLGLTVDEVTQFDNGSQWLSGAFGFFRNNDPAGGSAYFTGGGLRYGLTLNKMIFLRRSKAQDSIVAELGAFYYKILDNIDGTPGAFDVVPLIGTARYNIFFSENFGIFFYGGIVQNNVIKVNGGADQAAANKLDAAKDSLSSIYPTAGGGFLFRVGPNWDARVDLGFDSTSLGLTLRF